MILVAGVDFGTLNVRATLAELDKPTMSFVYHISVLPA
jgi:hypothetical protein